MLGSFMYLIETLKETHWQSWKIILQYVNDTKSHGFYYSTSNNFRIIGHMDSAANIDERNSTSGYMFHLGSRAISWASRKQPILSLFTKLSMWQQMQ
jgi:hypothetical protein